MLFLLEGASSAAVESVLLSSLLLSGGGMLPSVALESCEVIVAADA